MTSSPTDPLVWLPFDPEELGEDLRALHEAALCVGTRDPVRSAEPDLDLVEERGVANRHARVGTRRADDVEQRLDAHAVQPTTHLAFFAEPRLDPAA